MNADKRPDPNFDQDSYVKSLKKRIQEDKSISEEQQSYTAFTEDNSTPAAPMKFDGKQMKGETFDVIKAPTTNKKSLIVPIILISVLVIAMIVIVVFIVKGGSGDSDEPKDISISFVKPDEWGDSVYAYVYSKDNKDDNNAKWPGEKMEYIGGKYTYKVSSKIKDPLVIFNDNEGKHQYPKQFDPGLEVKEDEKYSVNSTTLGTSSITIKFKKPSDWKGKVYAYVYASEDNSQNNGKWPGAEMEKGKDDVYTYNVSDEIKDPLVIFSEEGQSGKKGQQYPSGKGLKVENNKTYAKS